ncbi:hypothetical protein H9P43_008395 [Blastocladiella emersonii ATCC 22665]|nr:hypothetical protein H9P43_008395 [Blastocladiella emersonii ATCC 22665]
MTASHNAQPAPGFDASAASAPAPADRAPAAAAPAKPPSAGDLTRDTSVRRTCCFCLDLRRAVLALLVFALAVNVASIAFSIVSVATGHGAPAWSVAGKNQAHLDELVKSATAAVVLAIFVNAVQIALLAWGLLTVLKRRVGHFRAFATINVVFALLSLVVLFFNFSVAGIASAAVQGYLAWVLVSYVDTLRAERGAAAAGRERERLEGKTTTVASPTKPSSPSAVRRTCCPNLPRTKLTAVVVALLVLTVNVNVGVIVHSLVTARSDPPASSVPGKDDGQALHPDEPSESTMAATALSLLAYAAQMVLFVVVAHGSLGLIAFLKFGVAGIVITVVQAYLTWTLSDAASALMGSNTPPRANFSSPRAGRRTCCGDLFLSSLTRIIFALLTTVLVVNVASIALSAVAGRDAPAWSVPGRGQAANPDAPITSSIAALVVALLINAAQMLLLLWGIDAAFQWRRAGPRPEQRTHPLVVVVLASSLLGLVVVLFNWSVAGIVSLAAEACLAWVLASYAESMRAASEMD